jgi:predicted Zn-dependent peptidase
VGLRAHLAGFPVLWQLDPKLETRNSELLAELAQGGILRDTLANGLRVVVDERRSAETVACYVTARGGSREDRDRPGSALLTSRVMFQGTSRRPSETELQRTVALVGGALSRGTSVELSSFSAVVPAQELDLGLDLLADIALDPLFTSGAVDRQKEIALQELAQRRARPSLLVDDLFQDAVFAGHPASTPVLGSPESVDGMTREVLLAARERHWGAANLILTIVGRVRANEAMASARRYFGALPSGSAITRTAVRPEPIDSPRTVRGEAGQQQVEFRLGFPAAGLLEPDRYPLTVMNAVMTGSGGRLFRSLRADRGLAYVAGSGYSAYTDTGAWFATAGVDAENLEIALDIVREEIDILRAKAPEAEEVARRQSQIAGRQILADEANSARASRLASQEALGTESTDEFVRRIRQVTPGDVLRVAQTYLDPNRSVLVVVGPSRPRRSSGV